MDQSAITASAKKLQTELTYFSGQSSIAAALNRSLSTIIGDAVSGRITTPMKTSSVPANRIWTEGELDDMPALSQAYGAFCAALTDTK